MMLNVLLPTYASVRCTESRTTARPRPAWLRPLLRCAGICALVWSMAAAANAQGVSPTPALARIGAVVDSNAREYFGLFPDVREFRSARVVSADHSVSVVVSRGSDASVRDTAVTIAPEMWSEVNRYLRDYEAMFQDDSLAESFDWTALRHLVHPIRPLRSHATSVRITTMHGSSVDGMLIWAGNAGIVVAPGMEEAGGTIPSDACVVLARADIARVDGREGFAGAMTGMTGMEIAGNDTVFREVALPWLRDHSLLHASMPPEVARLVAATRHAEASAGPASRSADEIREHGGQGVVSLSLTTGFLASGTGKARAQSFGQEERDVSLARFPVWSYSVQAGVRLSHRLRLTGRFAVATMPAASDSSNDERAGARIAAVSADFIAFRRAGFMMTPADHIELSLGAGVAWYEVEHDVRLVTPFEGDYSATTAGTDRFLAPLLHGEAAYYLFPGVAVRVDVVYTLVRNIDVPKMELQSSGGTGFVLERLDAHALRFPPLEAQMGLRFEF